MNDNDKPESDGREGDGAVLMSTRHPYDITPEMVAAGYAALEGSPLSLWPQKLKNVYTAMRDAEPALPEDINPDSLEEVPIPQAMWDTEQLRQAKILCRATGRRPELWDEDGNDMLKAEMLSMAGALVESIWGKRP